MPTAIPTEHNLESFASLVVPETANAMVYWAGDSKSTDASTDSNYPYGAMTAWKFRANFVARMTRSIGPFATAYAGTITQDGSSGTVFQPQNSVSTVGQQVPSTAAGAANAVAAGSVVATNGSPTPIGYWCKVYNANRSAGGEEWSSALNNLSGYAGGDWTSGVEVIARFCWYAHANGPTTMNVVTLRGSNTVNTVGINMASNPGTVQYIDVSCGTGAGIPKVRLAVTGSYDETNTTACILAPIFYRGTAGSPLPGVGLADLSTGGHTSASLLAALGGGTPTVSLALIRQHLAALTLNKPVGVVIDIGQNATGSETTQCNAGTVTAYKANVLAVINQTRSLFPSAKILLVNPRTSYNNTGATGYTETNNRTKGLALYQLAREQGCSYFNLYERIGRPVTTFCPTTVDAIHNTNNGAIIEAGVMWSALVDSWDASIRGLKRARGGG